MRTKKSEQAQNEPGLILKRLLKEHGITHERAARRAEIGLKMLWRTLTGRRPLDENLAKRIIASCDLGSAASSELITCIRKFTQREHPKKDNAAQHFGVFLAQHRLRSNISTRRLAVLCGIQQPNLVAIEKGRSVPSPLLAGELFAQLRLSRAEVLAYFRLLGQALVEHSPVSKSMSAPALCAFAEWLHLYQGKTSRSVSVGVEIAAIPNTKSFFAQLRVALSDLERQLTGEQQGRVSSAIPNACIEHSDGEMTLVVPLMIHLRP